MNSTTTKTTNLLDHNNGLSSFAVIPHGSSSSPAPEKHRHGSHLISRSLYSPKTSSFGNLSSVYSPRSGRFFNGRFEEPHFLDACFLCKKPLGSNRDIFMYRGDIPFCSEECRAEQIEFDESKEKKWRLSASVKAMRKKEKESNSSPNYPFHSGAVAAA